MTERFSIFNSELMLDVAELVVSGTLCIENLSLPNLNFVTVVSYLVGTGTTRRNRNFTTRQDDDGNGE